MTSPIADVIPLSQRADTIRARGETERPGQSLAVGVAVVHLARKPLREIPERPPDDAPHVAHRRDQSRAEPTGHDRKPRKPPPPVARVVDAAEGERLARVVEAREHTPAQHLADAQRIFPRRQVSIFEPLVLPEMPHVGEHEAHQMITGARIWTLSPASACRP
jgi:hypothetical protein